MEAVQIAAAVAYLPTQRGLFRGRRFRSPRVIIQHDHLSRLGVAQANMRLVFDRIRIGREMTNVLLQAIVLLLHLLYFCGELLVFYQLLLVNVDSVIARDHVVSQ